MDGKARSLRRRAALAACVLLGALGVLGGGLILRPQAASRGGGVGPAAQEPPGSSEPGPTLAGRPRPARPGASPGDLPFARGRVVGPGGEGVARVRVLARSHTQLGGRRQEAWPDVGGRAVATSDADGSFRVERRPDDLVSLVFLADGHAARELRDLADDPARNQDLRVVLEAGLRLAGSVRDTAGRPVAGAHVSLAWRPRAGEVVSPPQRSVTDADGRYLFASLPPTWDLALVAAAGYGASGFQDASGWGERHDFVLRRNALLVDVLDAHDGEPVAGAWGLLHAGDPPERWGTLERDARSEASGLVAPAGRIMLPGDAYQRRLHEDAVECDVQVFARHHRRARVRTLLQRDAEPPHFQMRLEEGEDDVVLGGAVVDGAGARVVVLLAAPSGTAAADDELPTLAVVAAGPDGVFGVRGLPPDRYRVRAELPGRAPSTVEVRAPALDLRLHLLPGGSLEVRVAGTDGVPQPGASVVVEPLEGRAVLVSQTDEAGVARFDGLPPGPCDVAPGFGGSVGSAARHPSHVRVHVVSGETAHAELVAPEPVPYGLRLVDEDGRPIEGARVRLGLGGSPIASLDLLTDPEGRVQGDLLPGAYRGVVDLPWCARIEPHVEVPVRPGPEHLVRATRNGVTLCGRVLEEGTDAPVGERPVFVQAAGSGADRTRLGTALTDGEGRFTMGGLPSSRVRVRFVLSGRGERGLVDPESPWPNANLEIDLSAPPAEVVLRVPRVQGAGAVARTTRLAAVVRAAADQAPVEGASLSCDVFRGGAWISAGAGTTDEKGRAEVFLLPGEKYRTHVNGPWLPKPPRWCYELLETPAQGDRIDLEVELERE